MSSSAPSQFSILLSEARRGSEEAKSQLILLVYQDLRRIAQHYINQENPSPSLQATALVHEVYMRLFGGEEIEWRDRSHFMVVATRQMRRILIDHARSLKSGKRGSGTRAASQTGGFSLPINENQDLVALNEALNDLEKLHPRVAQVVELRFFGGLTEEETAKVLGISASTVKREWKFARAWLYDEIVK